MRRFVLAALLAGVTALLAAWLLAGVHSVSAPLSAAGNRALTPAQARAAYGRVPLAFEANRGQQPAAVRYLARAGAGTLFMTDRGATLALAGHGDVPAAALRLSFPGGHARAVDAGRRLPGTVSYLSGARRVAGAATFGRVTYDAVWPGVDVAFYGNARRLEYDLLVAPHADASRIRLGFDGQRGARIARDGALELTLPGGRVVRELAPVAYQQAAGRRVAVGSRFVLTGDGHVRIALGAYDHARRLVIDPVLSYATYVGANSTDSATSVAVDASGNAYVAGSTASASFPVTAGAAQGTIAGGTSDAYVAKLNPAGTAILYATFLGGSAEDQGLGLAVGASGEVVLTGATASANFPTTAGAAQTTFGGGGSDAFVAKLDATGSTLVYSTFLGGPGPVAALLEKGTAVALDAAGNAYATGQGFNNLPTTPGAFDATTGNATFSGAYAVKLSPQGALVYATYLRGTGAAGGTAIAVDADGRAYVAGYAQNNGVYPTTAGAFQSAGTGSNDYFVTKLNAAGSGLEYSTLVGGQGLDQPGAIAVDGTGRAFVVGQVGTVASIGRVFPTTPDAARSATTPGFVAGVDANLTVLNPTGTALDYSTYIGGTSNSENAFGVAIDGAGNAYVVGSTTAANFPTTPGALHTTIGGNADGYLMEIRPGSSGYVYSTYVGGTGADVLNAIAVDGAGNAIVAGTTASVGQATPGTVKTLVGGTDGLVARFAATPPPVATTGAVSAVTASGATLAGTVNAAGTPTAYVFEYGTSTAFGSITTPDSAGSGAAGVPVSAQLSGLAQHTTYFARLVATSATGTSLGAVTSFTTGGAVAPPAATTLAPSAVGTSSAMFAGTLDSGQQATVFTFEYGPTTAFGSITTPAAMAGSSSPAAVAAPAGTLQPNTTYYVRLVAANASGTATGPVLAFVTGPGGPPVATTGAAGAISATGATLAATLDPGAAATTFTFEYGTTTAFGSLSAIDEVEAIGGPRQVSLPVTGLAPATTYVFRVVATNAGGTSTGAVESFTTPGGLTEGPPSH